MVAVVLLLLVDRNGFGVRGRGFVLYLCIDAISLIGDSNGGETTADCVELLVAVLEAGLKYTRSSSDALECARSLLEGLIVKRLEDSLGKGGEWVRTEESDGFDLGPEPQVMDGGIDLSDSRRR